MTDDTKGPEVTPDTDFDVPPEPSATEGSPEDSQGEEVVLDDKEGDVWKDLERKTKEGAEFAKKTGAENYARTLIRNQLVEKAMGIEEEMNKEGTEANKLKFVWDALTPEGRSEFLKGNTLLWSILRMAKKSAVPMLSIAQEAWGWFKLKAYKAESLDISDFKPETVQIYCALGLLDCSEAEAKEIDMMAAKGLKVAAKGAKVLGWLALLIPGAEEASPVLDKISKGASLAEKPAEWAAGIMPEVRNEVKHRSVEVQAARLEEHNAASENVGETVVPSNGPMDYAKKAANE